VVEFYGNELSRLRFEDPTAKEGEPAEVNMEVLLAKMTGSKDAKTRYQCMQTLNSGLKNFERVAALSLNMVAGGWHVENAERGFENLRSQRNLGNNVPDEVVDSLLDAVKTTGVAYCKRYYALKKNILKETQGLDAFTWADRNAAIDIGTAADEYSWTEAVDIVREGYAKFSPTMADLFTEMVDQKRIDVPAQNGKRGGAYCSSSYGHGPFQLLNFTGTQRDVATLAHESGHGESILITVRAIKMMSCFGHRRSLHAVVQARHSSVPPAAHLGGDGVDLRRDDRLPGPTRQGTERRGQARDAHG